MKNLYFLSFILLLIFSCETESDDIQEPIQENIETWNMSRQFAAPPLGATFEPGEVVWQLNNDTNLIQITNNHPVALFDSGEYPFVMESDSLFIDFNDGMTGFSMSTSEDEVILTRNPTPNLMDTLIIWSFNIEE